MSEPHDNTWQPFGFARLQPLGAPDRSLHILRQPGRPLPDDLAAPGRSAPGPSSGAQPRRHTDKNQVASPPPDQAARLRAAMESAFQRGLEEGCRQEQARQEATRQAGLEDFASRSNALLSALQSALSAEEARIADRLFHLSLEAASAMACRSLSDRDGALSAVLDDVLRRARDDTRRVEITLHPEDQEAAIGWRATRNDSVELQFRTDPTLTPGGCRVRCGDTLFDARVETRIARVLSGFGLTGDEIDAIVRRSGGSPTL